MSRDHLLLLALMLVSAAVFLGFRQSGPSALPTPVVDTSVSWLRRAPEDLPVKQLTLDDSNDRRSVRVLHPSKAVQQYLHDWLEPREQAAMAARSSLVCSAETAKTRLVSVRCVSVAPSEPGRAEPEPEYAALTLRIDGDAFEEVDLRGVLAPGVGEREVLDACRRSADPPLPCGWPPTTFAVVGGTSLFVCHGSSCVDIPEEEGAPPLLRRGLVRAESRGDQTVIKRSRAPCA